MRILIVSTFFPPENSIASLRPYSWAKWWSRFGHEVTVLTTSKEKQYNDLKLSNDSFKVIEIPLKTPFHKANSEIKKVENSEGNVNSTKQKISLKVKLLQFLKKCYSNFSNKTGCFYACRFPDWNDIWVKSAIKQINSNDYDLLVTTGGPYSVHRIGLAFRKTGWKGKWVCDWRDLFTKNHLFHGLWFFHLHEKHLEKMFHKNADLITTVSDGLAETLQTLTSTPVEVIYNGYDEEEFEFLFSAPRKKNKKYTISYLGTVYRQRQNPTPLFKALGELDKAGLITPEKLVIQFAGNNANVIDLAQKYGIEKYYTYLGFLSREQSLQLQYDSDAVLFLEYEDQKVKGVLTGKLFEYLYIARNILAVGCSNETSADELIEKCNAGICFGHDVKLIKTYILNEFEYKSQKKYEKSDLLINKAEVVMYSRKKQAEKLLKIIQQEK